MTRDDLENELRNLKLRHLSESELTAYCDQELDQMRRARMEAHLKQCFICERQLALLREEIAALSSREITAEDMALVERLMEQMEVAQKPSATRPTETAQVIPLRERLAEYLRQIATSWQAYFKQLESVRGSADQGGELWQGQSKDGVLKARAILEKNASLTIHFSSDETGLEGARLKIRLGSLSRETTLQRISDSEVYAKIEITRYQRPKNLSDIAIEIV